MKLKLKNFRCYTDKTFEFPDKGLILLNGINGKGKSTILNAIFFALYGDLRKPLTFGTASCMVEFEFTMNDLIFIIKRSVRPNRLTLSLISKDKETEPQNYEDDPAQEVINQEIMNIHEFLASSYIKQKSMSSILVMTPTEQVEFIKKLAFNSDDNLHIKTIIKNLIKDTEEDLIKIKSNIDIYKSQLKELKTDNTYIEVIEKDPLEAKNFTFNKLLEMIKKLKININDNKKSKKDLELKLSDLETKQKNHKSQIDKRIKLEVEINNLEEQLVNTFGNTFDNNDEETNNIESKETEFEELTLIREYYLLIDHIFELEERYQYELAKHHDEINKQLENCDKYILSDNEYHKLVQDQKSYLLSEELINEQNDIINAYNDQNESPSIILDKADIIVDINNRLNNKSYLTCPSCNTLLTIENNVLEIAESLEVFEKNDEDHQLLSLEKKKLFEKWLMILEKENDKIDDLDIDNIDEMINNHNLYINEKNKLLKNKLPIYFEDKKLIIEKLQKFKNNKFNEEFINKLDKEINEHNIEEKVDECSKYLEEYYVKKNNMCNLDKLLIKKQEELELLRNSFSDHNQDIENLRNEIKIVGEDIDVSTIKWEKANKIEKMVNQYNEYQKYLEKMKKWEDKINKSNEMLEDINKKYKNLLILKTKSNEAEILALESIIDNINEYAKDYLDIMFSNDPIIVRIENFKQMKKDVKCKMNTFIQYKGSDYDSIDQLSGGERQKCELAFELAVNSLINSKILMLDECINALDPEINGEIVELLSKIANEENKLIMVISHESVQGHFDHVIEL